MALLRRMVLLQSKRIMPAIALLNFPKTRVKDMERGCMMGARQGAAVNRRMATRNGAAGQPNVPWVQRWPNWFYLSTGICFAALLAIWFWDDQIGMALGGSVERFLVDAHTPGVQRTVWTILTVWLLGSFIGIVLRLGDWAWCSLCVAAGAALGYWGWKCCADPNSTRGGLAIVVGTFLMSLAANFFAAAAGGQTSITVVVNACVRINRKLGVLIRGQRMIRTTQVEQGAIQNQTLDNSEKLLAIEAIKANPDLDDKEKFQQILALTSPSPAAAKEQPKELALSPDITAFLERMASHAPLIDQVRTANALGKLDEAARLRDQYLAEMTAARQQQDYAAFVAFGDTEWLADRYNQAGEWYEKALAIRDDEFEIVNKAGLSFLRVRAGKDFASAMVNAEKWLRRGVEIAAKLGKSHTNHAVALNNLASLLKATNRLGEAEPLMKRALAIDEASFRKDHPNVATDLNNLASLLKATNRLGEAEPLMRRAAIIELKTAAAQKHHTPNLRPILDNYEAMLEAAGKTPAEARAAVDALCKEHGVTVDR